MSTTRRASSARRIGEVSSPSSAESGHQNFKTSVLQRAFTTPPAGQDVDEDEADHAKRSLVSSMLKGAPSRPHKVDRSHSLPSDLHAPRKGIAVGYESTLVNYKGVSRKLWHTRYDAYVQDSEAVDESKLFLGSFYTSHSAARAYDLAKLKLGCRYEELNFPAVDYDEEILTLLTEYSVSKLAETLVEISQASDRRTSRFRGVVAAEGGFEARLELGW